MPPKPVGDPIQQREGEGHYLELGDSKFRGESANTLDNEPRCLHEYYALGEDIGLAPILNFLGSDGGPLNLPCFIKFFECMFV